jgi:oligoendopeptidase F
MRKAFFTLFTLVLVLSMFACGGEKYKCDECGEVFDSEEALNEHVKEAHGEAEVTEPAEGTTEKPAEGAADVVAMKEDFKAVFDDVNEYMETHNQSNTSAGELSAAYADFATAFADMKEKYEGAAPADADKAEYDKTLELMGKAETSMSKYSDGIEKGVPDGIALSLEGATLWDEVKNEFGGGV